MQEEEPYYQQDEKQKQIQNAIEQSIALLMSSQNGRLFLLYLLDTTSVFKSLYQAGENLYFFEGRRSVGTEILTLLQKQDTKNLAKLFMEK